MKDYPTTATPVRFPDCHKDIPVPSLSPAGVSLSDPLVTIFMLDM